ncbi:DUF2231 domain-containing protein [Sphingomonas oryzagri]|jgi:uncharacterized membrane protein|uniref:DUF2231 domain-containing protein n=1 Tax=Sphingomonas oryzagri TaxID=3042314 RepID=A0ABT6MZI4_9SPHN|nr:DUF2231 domain-containing protein [Sphingomonas oryzagri]MDH7638216.1 hypothetical protein [Sphingomonas oryzagri]
MPSYVQAPEQRRPLFASLMSFPASCFVLTLLTDIVYANSYNMAWETASVWLLTIGLLAAFVFVLIGLFQAFVQGLWPSMTSRIGFAIVLILSIFNAFIHSRDGYTSVVPTGLTLSAIVVIFLLGVGILEHFAMSRRESIA